MVRILRQWRAPAAIVFTVVALDQAVKTSVSQPARNPGFLTGWAPLSAIAVIALSILVLIAFLAIVGRWAVQIGISPCIPALIVAGIFAHTLDRVRFGAVHDFLAIGWLIVDIADFAVAAGLMTLVVAFARRMLVLRRQSRTIVLEFPAFRAVVVDREVRPAA
jgi:hypothetical protein